MTDTAPSPEPVPEAPLPEVPAVTTVASTDPSVTISGASIEIPRFTIGQFVVQERPDRFGPPGATATRYGVVLGVDGGGVAVGWFGEVSPSVPEADIEEL